MDIFTDYFTREELVASLVNTQYVPRQLAPLFDTRGLTTTSMGVEKLSADTVSESDAIARGAPGKPVGLDKRTVETFSTESYAWDASVYADEVLGARAAGLSAIGEVVIDRRNRTMAKLRRHADFQHEYLRMQVLNDATNALGDAPDPTAIAFGVADSALLSSIEEKIISAMEDALGGLESGPLVAFCSRTFWRALLDSKTRQATYLNQSAASALREIPLPGQPLEFGNVYWYRYRPSGSIAITEGQAKVIPTGVDGLFLQAFAPDDTEESVGQGAQGQLYYPGAEPLPRNKGMQMWMQTHPKMICTRPEAVLTIDLS